MKKFFTTILSVAMFSLFTFTALTSATTGYGSGSALTQDSFTLEDMLVYAIQDEYTARAEYEKIMKVYGAQKPFSNIIVSEENHIAILKPLFANHGIQLPADTSADHVVVPDSLLDAYKTGVQAEINNIAMYDKFLEQVLPDDVRSAFIKLRDASYNHLNAFQNKVAQAEGTSDGSGSGGYRGGR
jgi:hypothetical protein